ncbi:hypothetical protein SJS85_16655 [Aeromonas caviae]|uniref:hypothetical protein n=1 Tax=Aeromonas caviae TaxID=648 RepID=UPI0029D499DD|nr:hypothetical protein [Aeromonas caviae]MDX7837040.1 hypothetical protein [Aeromonas caviae]
MDKKKEIRKSEFIHVMGNLYVIFTPLGTSGEETDIEYFFDDKTRLMKHSNGKFFNTVEKRDTKNDLSKDAFATHIVKEKKKSIDFTGLKVLLDPIVKVIEHYENIK